MSKIEPIQLQGYTDSNSNTALLHQDIQLLSQKLNEVIEWVGAHSALKDAPVDDTAPMLDADDILIRSVGEAAKQATAALKGKPLPSDIEAQFRERLKNRYYTDYEMLEPDLNAAISQAYERGYSEGAEDMKIICKISEDQRVIEELEKLLVKYEVDADRGADAEGMVPSAFIIERLAELKGKQDE